MAETPVGPYEAPRVIELGRLDDLAETPPEPPPAGLVDEPEPGS